MKNLLLTNWNIFKKRFENIKLDSYQIEGIMHMLSCFESKFKGCILADHMGLGKTRQTLCTILLLKENIKKMSEKSATFLIIVPKSVLIVWEKALKEDFPELVFYTYNGNNDDLKTTKASIILITYERIVKEYKNENLYFQETKFDLIVLDEGQRIKNETTLVFKAINNLKAYYKLILTGTPMENYFKHFINLSDFICPGYLDTFKYSITEDIIPKPLIKKIRSIIRGYVIRRTQKGTFNLPSLTINKVDCNLTQKQLLMLYDDFKIDPITLRLSYKKLLNYYKSGKDKQLKAEYDKLTELQILNYYTPEDEKRINALKTYLQKPIVKLNSIKLIMQHPKALIYFDKKFTVPDSFDVNDSEKFIKILEQVNQIPKGEKTIIFCQSAFLLLYLQIEFKKIGRNAYLLTGKGSVNERRKIVYKFQTEEPQEYKEGNTMHSDSLYHDILLVSTTIGNNGIDLSRANHIIFYDVPWNYSITDQAISRAYRRGQIRPVSVSMYIAKSTFEVSIWKRSLAIHKLHKKLFDNLTIDDLDTNIRNDMFDKQMIKNQLFKKEQQEKATHYFNEYLNKKDLIKKLKKNKSRAKKLQEDLAEWLSIIKKEHPVAYDLLYPKIIALSNNKFK